MGTIAAFQTDLGFCQLKIFKRSCLVVLPFLAS